MTEQTVERVNEYDVKVEGEHGTALIWVREDGACYCWRCSTRNCPHVLQYLEHEAKRS